MHTLSCVSLLATKKPAVQTGRFPPYPAIYAAARSAQPPDIRTYSAQVTSQGEQSCASSQNTPLQALRYHTTTLSCVSRVSLKYFCFSPIFPPPGRHPLSREQNAAAGDSPRGGTAPHMITAPAFRCAPSGRCGRRWPPGGCRRSGPGPTPWGCPPQTVRTAAGATRRPQCPSPRR